MLVVTQKARPEDDVEITLPDGTVIVVRVLAVERGRVSIGYDAPKAIPIIRRKAKEKREKEL